MPDADLYVNVCIFVIISYAMRYPVKSILFKRPQSQQKNKKRNAATRQYIGCLVCAYSVVFCLRSTASQSAIKIIKSGVVIG